MPVTARPACRSAQPAREGEAPGSRRRDAGRSASPVVNRSRRVIEASSARSLSAAQLRGRARAPDPASGAPPRGAPRGRDGASTRCRRPASRWRAAPRRPSDARRTLRPRPSGQHVGHPGMAQRGEERLGRRRAGIGVVGDGRPDGPLRGGDGRRPSRRRRSAGPASPPGAPAGVVSRCPTRLGGDLRDGDLLDRGEAVARLRARARRQGSRHVADRLGGARRDEGVDRGEALDRAVVAGERARGPGRRGRAEAARCALPVPCPAPPACARTPPPSGSRSAQLFVRGAAGGRPGRARRRSLHGWGRTSGRDVSRQREGGGAGPTGARRRRASPASTG